MAAHDRQGMSSSRKTTNPNQTVVTTRKQAVPKNVKGQACCVVIYGDQLGRRITLEGKNVIIGRSSKCELQIDQESVSRNHAKITYDGQRYVIEDLGSTNGTYVNDTLVERHYLRDGDQLKIGRTIFKFISGNNVETQYHEEIYRLMTIDGLTEVYNKRFFAEALEKEASRGVRYERPFSIVVFDIDHFKRINDTHGHLAGDAVLRQLGALVQGRARRDDIVARIGGEEFAALLPEVKLDGAVGFAKTLRELVERTPFYFEETRIPVTISLGVAQWAPGFKQVDDLMRSADEKLYDAKRGGRNKVCS